jgi:molybdopterin synthase sulfur carrier subunit
MRVQFYATLRAIVGEKSVEIALPEGASVMELAGEIARRWPPLADHIFDAEGKISRQVHFMIEGRNIRWLPMGAATKLFTGNAIDVFPPTAGG